MPAFGGFDKNQVYHRGKLNWPDHVFSYETNWEPVESEREAYEECRALYQWKKLELGKAGAEAFFGAPASSRQ